MEEQEQFMTESEALDFLGVSKSFMYQNRLGSHGDVIPFIRMGNRLYRYRKSDLIAWMNNRVTVKPLTVSQQAPVQPGKRRGRPTKAEQIAKRAAA